MKTHDVLDAVRQLATAMTRADEALGTDRCARVRQAALAEAVGGIAPLGLSADQMGHVAARLEVEVLVERLTRHSAAPAEARA